ncbi:DUF5801 repeats-in-toxin domain-containing protein, partial [Paracoccus endophyticus]|uniref:DUF5801 repeats-in-toxin domain-containing protein n=1 Tax=Paracoccus endophyticus TaxID=2233774 RepID=UPI00197E048A
VGGDGDGIGQGAAILLFVEANGSITGRTVAGGTVYFTISVDGSGNVTLARNPAVNLYHDDPANGDDPELLAAASALTLTKTVTDADGDSAAATIDLSSGVFRFEDDGPAGGLTTGFTKPVITVDESPVAEDGIVSASASFAGAFSPALADYGTDGAGSVGYALNVANGTASGLFALDPADKLGAGVGGDGDGIGQGAAILLFVEANGSITGRTVAGG